MIGLVDTSVFIADEQERPIDGDLPEELSVSSITIGELRLGVLMAVDLQARETRLSTLMFAASLRPLPIDDAVADRWATLVARLRSAGKRMPINDSWIAATALAHDLALVTQDDDFDVVDDLPIVKI